MSVGQVFAACNLTRVALGWEVVGSMYVFQYEVASGRPGHPGSSDRHRENHFLLAMDFPVQISAALGSSKGRTGTVDGELSGPWRE